VVPEKLFQDAPELHEFIEAGWLSEIGGPEILGLPMVGRRIGRTDNEYGDMLEFRTGAKAAKHLKSVSLGEIEVEHENVWRRRLNILLGPRNEINGLLAVADHMKFQREFLSENRFADNQGVGQVVLSQQKIEPLSRELLLRSLGR